MASDHNPFADPFGDPSVTAAASGGVASASGGTGLVGGGPIGAYGDAFHNPFAASAPTTSAYEKASPKKAPSAASGSKAPLLAQPGAVVEMKATSPRTSAPTITEDDLRVREANLLRREQELADREREIDQKMRDGTLAKPDNWPSKCYPLAYHSIPTEIPEPHRPFVRKFYAAALFTWLCIFFNWLTMVVGWLGGGITEITGNDALWASIYLLIGIPGSWKLWYRSLYYAFRDKATGKWVVFFLSFMMHIAFSVIMALGVPDCAAAGFFVMMKLFIAKHSLTGIFALCNLCIWGLNGLVSIVLLKQAHSIWKSGGGAKDLKKQVAQAAVAEAVSAQMEAGGDPATEL